MRCEITCLWNTFFFSSRRRHTRFDCDWSSDVCSSDLLERALAVRIRVEQAIGVLAERHRIRPRQAFEQLRAVARGRGQRVIDIAGDVIASATNPLLPLPEELSRPSMTQRQRGVSRRARETQ